MNAELYLKALRFGFQTGGRLFPGLAGKKAFDLFTTPRKIPRPEWEKKLLETSRPIALPQGLKGWTWGPDSGSPAVLLAHGWEGRGTQLGTFVPPLLQAGFRVITFDAPAHGESPGKRANMLIYARAIAEIGQALGPLHTVIAHSWGGGASLLAGAQGLQVQRFVLIAPASSVEGVFERYVDFLRIPPAAARELVVEAVRIVGKRPEEIRIAEDAGRLPQPALIFHDQADAEVPVEDSRRIAQAWPNARLVEVRGLGHRKILKAPEIVSQALEFIRPTT